MIPLEIQLIYLKLLVFKQYTLKELDSYKRGPVCKSATPEAMEKAKQFIDKYRT